MVTLGLRNRCHDPELIDRIDPGPDAMARMHEELGTINRYLGGHAASLSGIRVLAGERREVSVIDVGAGGADLARALCRGSRPTGPRFSVLSVDLSRGACRDAGRRARNIQGMSVAQADGFSLPIADRGVDIAHAALFLHHFAHEDAARLVAEMARVARLGIVVNDLHRHPLAHAGIRALTAAFSRSPLIRHDAPLSVRRGFTRRELLAIARDAGAPGPISWRWAFRLLLVSRSPASDERR